ncbi:uncharacterized protein LOC126741243 [Anthonomus grandis grandis]|uniref:uncharacterized protein LOC126741243 n=1 Tax=Anthonomus grandis grandis TaxID=2921223 RepID=UPI0021651323|nr:uncharacterized protein LOC126741243 [Anthonomus grandis grandis]
MKIVFVICVVVCLSEILCQNLNPDFQSDTSNSGDEFNLYDHGRLLDKIDDNKRVEANDRSFPSVIDINKNDQEELRKQSLKEFLESFAKKYNAKKNTNERPGENNLAQNLEEPSQSYTEHANIRDKSINNWSLLGVNRHKNPYDDKMGWVSLEPIPWSISKISKWQSKYKPSTEMPWDDHGAISSQRPYLQDDQDYDRPVSITPPSPYHYHRPTQSSDRYDTNIYDHIEISRPRPTFTTISSRPTAYYENKVHVQAHLPSYNWYGSTTMRPNGHKRKNCNDHNEQIITDGLPSNFPSNTYDHIRRKSTEKEIQTESHPFNGEGEWVLLSTTKGYKHPRNGQRSLSSDLSIKPVHTLRTSKGIQLTVLPPLKGSNVNMTTSHGGLLQVESTFESVEQAKQKFDKKQHTLKVKSKRKRRRTKKNGNSVTQKDSQNRQTTPHYGDPGAVMAAVGAGMIPATMAMMMPMALSGG